MIANIIRGNSSDEPKAQLLFVVDLGSTRNRNRAVLDKHMAHARVSSPCSDQGWHTSARDLSSISRRRAIAAGLVYPWRDSQLPP